MTRHMPFGSGDDAVRAAVAPMLAELRAELVVLPRERIIEQHLDMMTFERQVLDAPRPAVRKPRRPAARPRVAVALACITATIASCGLSAAGALPEPLQHITDTIAHTLGVPEPHDATPATHSGAAPLPTTIAPPVTHPRTSTSTPSVPAVTAPKAAKPTTPKTTTHAHTPVGHASTPPTTTASPSAGTPTFPARPTKGTHRIEPTPPPKPPSNNSQNTPPGYPTDWRDAAISAASNALQTCAQAGVLDPAHCPQSATANGPATDVHWALLNDPGLSAAAVAHTTRAANGAQQTIVTVYERFQMDATYTASGATTVAYSSGVAQATMTWNGTDFDHVSLATGSVAGHVERGVTVPGLIRPAGVGDIAVLGALHDVFVGCTAPSSDGACPAGGVLDTPTTAQSTLVGDPTNGATVSFDSRTGLFTVTGSYAMTASDGTTVSGPYTATLFFDGWALETISVT